MVLLCVLRGRDGGQCTESTVSVSSKVGLLPINLGWLKKSVINGRTFGGDEERLERKAQIILYRNSLAHHFYLLG